MSQGVNRTTDEDTDSSVTVDPGEIAETDAPTVAEKPYKVVFEANRCIGTGKCASVSDNWELDVATGVARPEAYFFSEEALDENVRAAEACPAKKGAGVIHIIDRRTWEEISPDPGGTGSLSVDW